MCRAGRHRRPIDAVARLPGKTPDTLAVLDAPRVTRQLRLSRGATAPIGLELELLVVNHRDAAPERIADATFTLLNDVRELVPDELTAALGVRLVLPRREVEIGADGEGESADGRSVGADVDAHVGEIGLEVALHLLSNGRRQRSPLF